MNVHVYTSDPDKVSAADVRAALESAGYFVLEVTVNDGEAS